METRAEMNRRLSYLIAFFVTTLSALPVSLAGTVSVSRDEIAQSLVGKIQLAKDLEDSLKPEEVDALRQDAQQSVVAAAQEVLPPTLEYGNGQNALSATKGSIILRYADHEYLSLAVKKAVMDISLDKAFQQKRTAALSAEIKDQLRKDIKAYTTEIRTSMERNLSGAGFQFTKEQIGEQVEGVERMLLSQMDNPSTYWMTAPLPETGVPDLVKGFDTRLAGSREAIAKQIKEAADRGATDADLKAMRKGILGEITRAGTSAMLKAATDPKLKAIKPDELAPGYSDVVKKLTDAENTLGRLKRAKEAAAREKKVAVEIAKDGLARVNEEAERKMFDPACFPPTSQSRPAASQATSGPSKGHASEEEEFFHWGSWTSWGSGTTLLTVACLLVGRMYYRRRERAG